MRNGSPVFRAAPTETELYVAKTIPTLMASAAPNYIQRVSITNPPPWSVTVMVSNTSVPISIRTSTTERVTCAESRINSDGDLCSGLFKHVIFLCELFVQWVADNQSQMRTHSTHLAAACKFYWSISFRSTLKCKDRLSVTGRMYLLN